MPDLVAVTSLWRCGAVVVWWASTSQPGTHVDLLVFKFICVLPHDSPRGCGLRVYVSPDYLVDTSLPAVFALSRPHTAIHRTSRHNVIWQYFHAMAHCNTRWERVATMTRAQQLPHTGIGLCSPQPAHLRGARHTGILETTTQV